MSEEGPVNFIAPPISENTEGPSPILSIPQKRRIPLFAKIGLVCVLGFIIFGVVFAVGLKTSGDGDTDVQGFSLFSTFERLIGSSEKALAGEGDDRINILLLGIGGAGHDGPELTDTIILASYKPSTNDVGLISIPRDLTVPVLGYGYPKINAVNAYAEEANRGSGMTATAKTVSTILSQPVPYTIKVDFRGFEDIVNAIGGVDVTVDTSFDDPTYPVDDDAGNVQTVSFTQGVMHMDGKTALMFARSRHGTNGEGSDFSRAKRQQKILVAVKDKMLSLGVLLNPVALNRIAGSILKNVKTNLTLWEIIKFAKYIPSIDPAHIAAHVVDDRTGGIVYATTMNGAYILLPKKDDWSDFKTLAKNIFEKTDGGTSFAVAPVSSTRTNAVTVEIQNGTGISGLASQSAQLLESSGFTVVGIGNAADRTYAKTLIYDLTGGKKGMELNELKSYLKADVVMTPGGYLTGSGVVPKNVSESANAKDLLTSSEHVDFLVIIGENAQSIVLR